MVYGIELLFYEVIENFMKIILYEQATISQQNMGFSEPNAF